MPSRPKTTRYVLLGVIQTLGTASGYEAQRFVAQSIGHFWSESFGQIYPELAALRGAGWITPVKEAGRGRRARLRYRVTPAGRRVLRQWLKQPAAPAPIRHEALLKVFFGIQLSTSEVAAHLNREELASSARLQQLTGIADGLLRDSLSDPDLAFSLMTIRAGQRRAAAMLAWTDDCRGLLAAKSKGANAVAQVWRRLSGEAP